MATPMIREAVGVFADADALQRAADDLLIAGFDRSYLSLMADGRTVERRLGRRYAAIDEAAADPRAPHIGFVGRDSRIEGKGAAAAVLGYVGAVAAAGSVVAAGGAVEFALAAAAAAGGTAGAIGAALAHLLDRPHARRLAEQMAQGGILLWVRTVTPHCEEKACAILRGHGAGQVHVHELPHYAVTRDGGVSQRLAWIDKPLPSWGGSRAAAAVAAEPALPVA